MGHQSPAGGNYFVPGISNWHGYVTTKRPDRTMEKLIAIGKITADLLGVGWIGKIIIERVSNALELIATGIVLIYACGRWYFRLRRDHVLLRKEMLEQMERERAFNKLVSEKKE